MITKSLPLLSYLIDGLIHHQRGRKRFHVKRQTWGSTREVSVERKADIHLSKGVCSVPQEDAEDTEMNKR